MLLLFVFGLFAIGCADEEAPHETQSAKQETSAPSATTSADTIDVPPTEPNSFDTVTSPSSGAPAPKETLTTAQKNRIGPTLRRILRGDSLTLTRVEPVTTREGTPVYEVLIECDDPTALRDAGLPLTSVQGALITARLTVDEIRTAAAVEAVGSIRAAAQLEPHSPGARPSASEPSWSQ